MSDVKVLIADDEKGIRDIIKEYLLSEEFVVVEAIDGVDALNKFQNNQIHLVVLDVMMPKMDGWKVCREIRKSSNVPIILLTARGEEYDVLFGFELGIDDYITKPFSPKELIARIKAILARSAAKQNEQSLKNSIIIENMTVDFDARALYIEGNQINMTPKEYELFIFLIQNQRKVFTREQLLDQVWGYDFYGDIRTVDTHIKSIRESVGKYRNWIKTVWGVGYKLEVEDKK